MGRWKASSEMKCRCSKKWNVKAEEVKVVVSVGC